MSDWPTDLVTELRLSEHRDKELPPDIVVSWPWSLSTKLEEPTTVDRGFRKKQYYGVDFRGKDLSRKDLSKKTFTWCNFKGSNLQYTNLALTKFKYCNLMQADLNGANLFRTDYTIKYKEDMLFTRVVASLMERPNDTLLDTIQRVGSAETQRIIKLYGALTAVPFITRNSCKFLKGQIPDLLEKGIKDVYHQYVQEEKQNV